MRKTSLTGKNFILGAPSELGTERIFAMDPRVNSPMEPGFAVASEGEVDAAAKAAAEASHEFSAAGFSRRAEFLDAAAAQIEGLGEELIQRAEAETALPPARLIGERGRTCAQLRMFAELVREGSWVDARIETADPARSPVPKPDLRRMLAPIGPVAVFGASNFPMAYSVAGGDTASAFAAGCPVVVKAHPSHPGTSELVAGAIIAALRETSMPLGAFALLHGGKEVGEELVRHAAIEAVGFTGSQSAGRSLFNLAAERPRPIPVFAEMGSVNPVFLLPGALAERVEAIASGYVDSLTLGVGQFCTNPGLLIGIDNADFEACLTLIAKSLATKPAGVMLNQNILSRYQSEVAERAADSRIESLYSPGQPDGHAQPAMFFTTGAKFLAGPDLASEVFGPAALAVKCESVSQLLQVAAAACGQLTASVHHSASDSEAVNALMPVLARIAGRVVANGFPTGVEVCPAMQHGGPYPASTDSRFTSVGSAAIFRFARPVCYQNFLAQPSFDGTAGIDWLPPELQDGNPRGILRLINGKLTRDGVQ